MVSTESEPLDIAHTSENMVTLNLPPFDPSKTLVWLVQVESMFHARRVTSQSSRFHSLVSALPTAIVEQLLDVIHPTPPANPYDTLKEALLKRTSASDDQRLQQLLSGVELGDRTPSQLLRHMRSLVGNLKVDDTILKQLWSKRLSSTTNAILSAVDPNSSLDSLAAVADQIHDRIQPAHIAPVSETPSSNFVDRTARLENIVEQLAAQVSQLTCDRRRRRSRSRYRSPSRTRSTSQSSNRICRYHRRFGDKAKHCIFPCDHPSSVYHRQESGNSHAKQ